MRGQITVFIILGILVLLVIGGILVTNGRRAQEASIPQTEAVAEAAQPIQDFIIGCMALTGKQAIQAIGDHGGYAALSSIPGADINPGEPTESDVLMLGQDSAYGVPYWWALESKNACEKDCAFASKRPALYKKDGSPSIEGQIEQAVIDALPSCLKQFEPFKPQGFTVEAVGKPSVRAVITNDDVVIGLTQEFKARRAQDTYVLSQFASAVPVRLKDAYDLATNLTVLESENAFLAKHAREIITVYSRTDPQALPPVSTVEFELGPGVVWVKELVKTRLAQLLQSYVPILQVFGTQNYRELLVPDGTTNEETVNNVLNRNAVIPQLRPWPYHEVYLSYQKNWKPYVDLNCRGQVCRADSFLNQLGFVFGVQNYNFAYDVSYPVLVEVREPEAFNGEGFSFRFALEGNLRDNEPLTSQWQPLVSVEQEFGTQLCKDNQRTSGVFTIQLKDSATNEPVDGAVVFSCGEESCDVGEAKNGVLETRLPRCLGGTIGVSAENYVVDAQPVTTADAAQTVNVGMHRTVELDASSMKYRLRKNVQDTIITGGESPVAASSGSWGFDSNPVLFTNNDQAVITLQRKNGGLNSFASVCGSPILVGPRLDQDVRLAAGNYTVTVMSLYHGDVTFPPTYRCGGNKDGYTFTPGTTGGLAKGPIEKAGKAACYYVPENAIKFGNVDENGNPAKPSGAPCSAPKPFPSGTMQFDWEVTPQMLRFAKHVTFKTVTVGVDVQGTPLVVEDFEQIAKVQNYVDAEPKLFWPEVTP